jgi:hypothetical protein
MPNNWHICKEGQAGNKKRQRRGLLVFSELPSLPSAGSRSDCFHNFLSCTNFDKRIWLSSAAFGALKNILTNKGIDLKVKGSVYVVLCLSILLYGSEIWCLRDDLFNRLRHFHHRCTRTMCRITIAQTSRHRISSSGLFKRLSIESFDKYYNGRFYRWTGHVARMPFTRAPRKI